MHHDAISRSLLHLLQLRWTARGRTRQPEDATFREIATCLAVGSVTLIDLLEELMAAGCIDPVYVEHRGATHIAYRISEIGRRVLLTDRTAQRRLPFDA